MATQSGIFTFDGLPVPAAGERHSAERGAILTQGTEGVWTRERRPSGVTRAASRLAASWDGRLDNRDDLLRRLGGASSGLTGDAQIALAIFERWGSDGLNALVGEWSMAIWDSVDRRVHLARDYMGTRPLYYCVDRRYVAWSSDLAELVARTGRTQALTDRFAARFMTLHMSPDTTPYEDVLAVPPGVCVSISSSGRLTRRRFWSLQVGYIHYPDPRTYEAQLAALWRDAVQARLQTEGAVWAELSGGLDSSSIVCMADLLVKRGAVAARAVRLVSHATLHSSDGDERRFIAEVERQVRATSEIIGVEDNQEQTDPARAWVTPYALHGMGLETTRRVRADGGRLVLSGRLGDAIMGCQPDNSLAVFDDLARGHVLVALRNLRAWSRSTRKPFVQLAWRLFAPGADAAPETGGALLAPRLRAMLRDIPRIGVPSGLRRSKRLLARMVLEYSNGARFDVPDRSPDLVYAYPFTHRPLVDFMLAIPGDQLSAPGLPRSVMRRAFEHLVPPRILRRVSKGYYPPAAFRAARQLAASMLTADRLEVVERGWIDPDRLRSALRVLTDGGGASGGEIHRVLGLERWLQARRATISTESQ
jgi:asparagine synthase (glutamine-hydrolysing)